MRSVSGPYIGLVLQPVRCGFFSQAKIAFGPAGCRARMDRLLVLLSLGIVALIVAVPLWHELRRILGSLEVRSWLRSRAPGSVAFPLHRELGFKQPCPVVQEPQVAWRVGSDA